MSNVSNNANSKKKKMKLKFGKTHECVSKRILNYMSSSGIYSRMKMRPHSM
jgi:hypothetical protein